MKIAVLICRILLGVVFLFFGLNGFLHFLPMQSMPGPAGQFTGALFVSHEFFAISAFEVMSGALLLAGQFVPLGLTILGPVIMNILLFHIFMAPSGIPVALVATLLWFVVFAGYRASFAGIFAQKPGVRP